jgi:hypothetical protein
MHCYMHYIWCISCQLRVVLPCYTGRDNQRYSVCNSRHLCSWQYAGKSLCRPIAQVVVHLKEFPEDGYMYQPKQLGVTFISIYTSAVSWNKFLLVQCIISFWNYVDHLYIIRDFVILHHVDVCRSPWSNTYDPPLEDGSMPSERLRKLEIDANHAFDQYREMYFEGGVSSVYLWDLDHGFAGNVLQLGTKNRSCPVFCYSNQCTINLL